MLRKSPEWWLYWLKSAKFLFIVQYKTENFGSKMFIELVVPDQVRFDRARFPILTRKCDIHRSLVQKYPWIIALPIHRTLFFFGGYNLRLFIYDFKLFSLVIFFSCVLNVKNKYSAKVDETNEGKRVNGRHWKQMWNCFLLAWKL